MADRDDDIAEKGTARTAEFSTKKPLPPIGSNEDGEKSSTVTQSTDHSANAQKKDEDEKSVASSRGSIKSAPRVLRGFRREVYTDDDDSDDEASGRTRSKRGSRTNISKRKAFDGREVTFVTLDTQTDWDWVEEVEQSGTARTIASSPDKLVADEKEKQEAAQSPKKPRSPGPMWTLTSRTNRSSGSVASASSRPSSCKASKADASESKDLVEGTQYPTPRDDEYGIPILDLSSDTDDSSDEEVSHKKVKDDRTFIPSVGPPNILQYQRESEQQEISVDDPESRMLEEDFEKDDDGMVHGMFSGECEFCKNELKPFPSVEQQLKYPPELLYCCNDYREFVEFVLLTSEQLEAEQQKKNEMINIKPHEHVGSKQERNAAKEKAVQRMRERELQRRQQEASGLQQNFFASGQSNAKNRLAGGMVPMKDAFVARQMKTINYQLSSQKCLEEGWTLRPPSPLPEDEEEEVFIPEPLNPALLAEGKTGGRLSTLSNQAESNITDHRQKMERKRGRTISALSDDLEGSHLVFGQREEEEDNFEDGLAYRPDSSFIKPYLLDRLLVEKFYESGQKFVTMFPDGTGNVFYPSGNLAILISSVKLGQFHYTIHHDLQKSGVAAAFEPNGCGYCYYPNGDVRLYIDQYGGIELDVNGGKKRKWSWKDQVSHVHAPPFQPICIGLNKRMGLRVMSQDNIALTFSASRRSCRFNMGVRLKLVAPENIPLKEIEENSIFLEEKKNHVETILSKVANLLKFPNSPKVDKMLPPLHVTSNINKTEKLKQERQVLLAQQAERDRKQTSIAAS